MGNSLEAAWKGGCSQDWLPHRLYGVPYMDPERWKSVEALYHAALALEPGQRNSFLNTASPDTALRLEVESLLGFAEEADRLLAARPELPLLLDLHPTFQAGLMLSRRFRIVRLLGSGGMGEVYEAADVVMSESVALKVIRSDIADQERLRGRLLQEVHAAKRITHPGVCRIHDMHLHEFEGGQEVMFLTMELLRGETLGTRIRRAGPLDLGDACSVAEQLAGALTAAHRARVIHRDFKSENIILEPVPGAGMRAVVTDFGLARSEGRPADMKTLTQTGQIVGTLAYMAPEQLLGAPATPAADIYAFGVVLYEMVTGSQPFIGRSQLEIAAQRLKSAPLSPRTLIPGLPSQWERAILRCLERDPVNRFSDASDVWRAISR